MRGIALAVALLLLSSCAVKRQPLEHPELRCTCVLGSGLDRSDPDFTDPSDCVIHGPMDEDNFYLYSDGTWK